MQCGPNDLFCFVLRWLIEHEAVSSEGAEAIASVLAGTHPMMTMVMGWLHENASKLAAAASFSFAVWKWWRYREAVLHKRLEEYIKESDRRLAPSRDEVLQLIERPDRRNNVRQPAFAPEMHGLLMRRGWTAAAEVARPYGSLRAHLAKVDGDLVKRINTARDAVEVLTRQRAAVSTIEGALASAQAGGAKTSEKAAPFIETALNAYQRALDLQGKRPDVILVEGKAVQLMRLEKYEAALLSLEQLREAAKDGSDARSADFLLSRVARYEALIRKATGQTNAYETNEGALALRMPHAATIGGWDEIEQAELHFTAAYLTRSNRPIKREEQLNKALASYDRALRDLPRWRRPLMPASRRLWHAAIQGKERVRRARDQKLTPQDLAWLFQPVPPSGSSDKPQQPTKPIG